MPIWPSPIGYENPWICQFDHPPSDMDIHRNTDIRRKFRWFPNMPQRIRMLKLQALKPLVFQPPYSILMYLSKFKTSYEDPDPLLLLQCDALNYFLKYNTSQS